MTDVTEPTEPSKPSDPSTDLAQSDPTLADSQQKMGLLKQMYRGTNDFDFTKMFRRAGVLSVILVIGSIVAIFTMGLKLSIDFEGGSEWEIPSESFTEAQAGDVLAAAGISGAQYQEAETADGDRVLRVSAQAESVQEGAEVAAQLAEEAGLDAEAVSVNTVGPSWGDDITRQARTSLIVFMVLVALYITWRLEARMAAAALIAVVHDIIITLGVYAVFQLTITPATVISFLTILGFSLYDTIVVYDRVQENADRIGRSGRYTYTAIMRRSLNQVLMRSINTTVTTILPIISMLVVGRYIFGQDTLGDFSLALLIGLLAGTYSSLFVASPLTSWLKEREGRWREIRNRLVAKGVDVKDTSWHGIGPETRTSAPAAASAVAAGGTSGAGSTTAKPAGSGAQPLTHRGHPPRPRKKKRR